MYFKSLTSLKIINTNECEIFKRRATRFHKKLVTFENKKRSSFTKSANDFHTSLQNDVKEISTMFKESLKDDEDEVKQTNVVDIIEMDDFFEQ